MDVVLGFDTSCYTTSAAAVDGRGRVVGSRRMLLPVEHGQRGLRQSEAVFAHVRQLPEVMAALSVDLKRAEARVCAVAAASAPREGPDSYMPVFTVGLSHAEVLAAALRVPCHRFSHQQGHIAAGQIGGGDMGERFVALHLSGGTTDLLCSDRGRLTRIGGSLDLQAGQLVDRVGVAMGLPFPAGASLERLALDGKEGPKGLLPASMEGEDLLCHFSGAETRCARLLSEGGLSPEAMALEVFDLLARTVARLAAAGCRKEGVRQALVVGGVASSLLLRRMAAERLHKAGGQAELLFGLPEYSGDNAAGIALLGMREQGSA